MAHFLLFVFLFASQLVAGFSTQKLPPPNYGKKISILSIDGGGIKGIIPATVLENLENALKNKSKDERTSLADYFDVIAGTSTGGILTAMLATPNTSDTNRPPLFNASEIVQFYKEYGPSIFQPSNGFWAPKYNATFLRNKIGVLLKETRLSQTLTKVVIPTFDLKKLNPIIFSSYKLETNHSLDAKLSDICIGTSAAPTLFAPYKFKNDDVEFNLIDGAATADNPALVAVSEVIRHNKINEDTEILLLSLGTGKTQVEEKYDADTAANWNSNDLQWAGAVQDIVDQSIPDMILYYLATVFPGLMPTENYLRIQEYNMKPSENNMTNVSEANLNNLVKIGENLLQQKVKKMNVDTFVPAAEIDQTNAQALDSLADKLYKERQLRLKRKAMEKGGRPFIEPVRVPLDQSQA